MDDVQMFSPDGVNEVVLGVYGVEDWITSTELRQRHLAGKKTVQCDGTWLTDASFELQAWVEERFDRYTFFAANQVSVFGDDGTILKMRFGRGKLQVEVFGDPKGVAQMNVYLAEHFRKAENLIQWIYNDRGDDISVPLNYRPAIKAAYPWIVNGLENYIDDYINSPASVLILIGPPGTGKTTFIKNLIHRSKSDAKVAYDPKVMMQDSFFAGFIEDDTRFLIMEDADEFLRSRTEGNTMMHKFLNVSDGLVSAIDKKIVFSVNLESVSDIDKALLRPGRCFDVLQFRPLDREESKAVLKEVGDDRPLKDGNEFALAELFASQPSGKPTLPKRRMGF